MRPFQDTDTVTSVAGKLEIERSGRLRRLAIIVSMAAVPCLVAPVEAEHASPQPPAATRLDTVENGGAGDEDPPSQIREPAADPRTRARNSEPVIAAPHPVSHPRDAMFPVELRPLRPYLQLANRFGTRALKPGALIGSDPVSDAAQAIKSELARVGLRYSFDQAIVLSSMSDRTQGDSVIGAYAHDFFGNWTIFEGDEFGGTCGWVTAKTVGAIGLGVDLDEQNVRSNIGALVSPNNNYHSVNFAFEEVAWAQSFVDGEFVVMVGQVNQTNYLDINRYANSSHGQFMNAALVNSMVLPAPGNNLGVNVQWQPADGLYLMFGMGPNNQGLGDNPWRDVSADNVSYVGELGVVVPDVCGLGPGTYRVQPFIATFDGDVGGGVAFNVEQQLGAESPLGFFTRVGFGDDVTGSVPGAVKTQVSAGLALLSPFVQREDRDYFSRANNDFAGIGFAWTQPVEVTGATGQFHEDEYALELTCAIQLTPTTTIQPDLQFVWDPINNPDGGPATVFQIQLNIAW
jgi:carbohydrate-selective porin OprB